MEAHGFQLLSKSLQTSECFWKPLLITEVKFRLYVSIIDFLLIVIILDHGLFRISLLTCHHMFCARKV
jgi:hypothetical protein